LGQTPGVPCDPPLPASPPRAWAEINLSALRHNLAVARQLGGQDIMAVVKAGAYGHGLEELATALDAESLAFFGVANVGEARRLTAAGITTPIYLLGPCFDDERAEVVANRWVPCISSRHEADQFNALAAGCDRELAVHLTIDTGMGRGGFLPDQVADALGHLSTLPALRVTGLGSHLPVADEDPDFTRTQFDRFDRLVEQLTSHSRAPGSHSRAPGSHFRVPSSHFHIHLSNSAGLLAYRSRTTNLVRPGLMLYGCSPLPDFQEMLRPVMTLKSRVSIVRDLPAGHGVSYGRTAILSRPTRVATVGIGYGDGYPRALSDNHPEVLIHNTRCPLLGRVTMDQVMADVTEVPACTAGDEVELFGPNIPVTEVARKANTIPWEIFTGITSRVTRIHLENSTP
jgi:alanine racemase